MYAPSTAVLVSELMKFLISYVTYHMSDTNTRKLSIREMAVDVPMLVEVSIPSALYVLQNNLQYIAMSSLPAAIYQVLVQMKIITAAILSKIYLKRLISAKQWVSISALTFGVIIVQLSLQIKSIAFSNLNIPLGVVAVILSCFTSGYAGVKLESTLKDSRESLWVRNLQISIVSITIAGLACLKDFRSLWEHGFFHGYSPLVFLVILIQAVGGILVSLVVKNTSTIVKGFATAASIIVTSFISAFFLNDVKINATFLVGALIVCLSTITYSSR
jgi:UDP-sugar transporter A1/2/3